MLFATRSRWGQRLGQEKAASENSNLRKAKVLEIRRFRGLLVRREGFEPPAFWSVGCLTRKSESFRLRFVLFTTIRSVSFPLFPSSPARFFRILGQNWVRSCREDKRRYRSRQKNLPQIPKNEKAPAPHVRVRCIILPRKKQAKTRAGLLRLHFMPKKLHFVPSFAQNGASVL